MWKERKKEWEAGGCLHWPAAEMCCASCSVKW